MIGLNTRYYILEDQILDNDLFNHNQVYFNDTMFYTKNKT